MKFIYPVQWTLAIEIAFGICIGMVGGDSSFDAFPFDMQMFKIMFPTARIKKSIHSHGLLRMALCGLLLLIGFAILASWLARSRGFYRDLDFFTFWLGGRMAAQGQDVYNSSLWASNHTVYGSTWLENPFFVYPLSTAVFFIPLGILPIEAASRIWIFLSLGMIVLGLIIFLSAWKNQIWKKMVFPIVISTALFRPTFLTILHGQLDSFLFLVFAVTVFFFVREKNTLAHLCLPLLLIKPNIGVPMIGLYALWLIIHSKWKDILQIIGVGSLFVMIPLFFDSSWLVKFIHTSLYKGQDANLYPTLRGAAGVICHGRSGCSTALWIILSILLVGSVIYLVIKKKNMLSSENVLLISLLLTILVTPYLRAYDLIFLLFPILKILDICAEKGWKFWKLYSFYFLWMVTSIGLMFAAVRLNHDIWSVFLTITVFIIFSAVTLFSKPTEHVSLS
jgi:hypothetical protein